MNDFIDDHSDCRCIEKLEENERRNIFIKQCTECNIELDYIESANDIPSLYETYSCPRCHRVWEATYELKEMSEVQV